LNGVSPIASIVAPLSRLLDKAAEAARAITVPAGDDRVAEVLFWIEAMQRAGIEHGRDAGIHAEADDFNARLKAIANTARDMATAMDFAFLVDPDRKLLSIGYSAADNGLDRNCYDLLASEARLASLFAIAKG